MSVEQYQSSNNEEHQSDNQSNNESDNQSENEDDDEYKCLNQYINIEKFEDKQEFLSLLSRELKIMIRENILFHYLSQNADANLKRSLFDDLKLINDELYKNQS